MFNFTDFIKSTALYSVLAFLPMASRFVLFPIFVNYLSQSDYGIIGLNATIVSVLTIVTSFKVDDAFGRFFLDYRKNKKLLNTYTSTIFNTLLLIGVIVPRSIFYFIYHY